MNGADGKRQSSGRVQQVGDLKLWVSEAGQGPPLLLLHGIAASADTWQAVLPGLAEEHRVIAPDLPGCRRSDKPDTGYEVGALANVVLGLMDALDLAEVDLLGHSLGGHIALELALAHPDRVRSLVLVDAGGLGREIHAEALEPLLKDVNEANVRGFLAAAIVHPERLPSAMARIMARELAAPDARAALYVMARMSAGPDGQRHSLAHRLGELQPRTLVVWGEQDAVIPCQQGRDSAALIPNARYVAIPDCGHCPHLEQPQALIATVNAFLEAGV